MKSKVNIIIAVDVIGALSDKTLLNSNVCMMDNSEYQSKGQGTPNLATVVVAGQEVQWTVYAVDLQTPVVIKSIRFMHREAEDSRQDVDAVGASDALHLNVWSGIVPPWMVPGVAYYYQVEFKMYEGINSVMSIDSPSLTCI